MQRDSLDSVAADVADVDACFVDVAVPFGQGDLGVVAAFGSSSGFACRRELAWPGYVAE